MTCLPCWCAPLATRCVVSGQEAAVKKFRKRAFRVENDKPVFDFNDFIPMPEILRDTVSGTASINGAILLTLIRWHDAAERGWAHH